jgi:acetyl-CoA carboxylase carboxyltransferase component
MATTTTFRSNQDELGGTQKMTHTSGNFDLPYDDPAIVNPQNSSFPKMVINSDHRHPDHDSHLVNKKVTRPVTEVTLYKTW